MERSASIQRALDYIDERICDKLNAAAIAGVAGYSPFHFCRLFSNTVGIPLMTYVTWRKLEYALYHLSQGRKGIDVAMEYGFETHAGFTKAFRRWYGFPPHLCYTRIAAHPPEKATVSMITTRFYGGKALNPHIFWYTPFSVVGYGSRHTKHNIKTTADAPTFWHTIDLDYGSLLTKLHDTFTLSKHFEVSMCYAVDEATGEFTYLLGRGIDQPADLAHIEPDMTRVDIAGGLYAVFSTPPADSLVQVAQETWNGIFLNWLPQSEFEFDDTRQEFEYHDQRDHGWFFGGRVQMDICVPIRQKAEEKRKVQLRSGGK